MIDGEEEDARAGLADRALGRGAGASPPPESDLSCLPIVPPVEPAWANAVALAAKARNPDIQHDCNETFHLIRAHHVASSISPMNCARCIAAKPAHAPGLSHYRKYGREFIGRPRGLHPA